MLRIPGVPLAAAVLFLVAGCSGSDSSNTIAVASPTAPVGNVAAPAGRNWAETVSRTAEGGYVMGNPDAPVKLIEYGSRTCPHCAAFDRDGVPAMQAGPIAAGRLSYEFRDFPVHQAVDVGPILLGQCVAPAQFFPMLDAMMRAQQTLIYRDRQPSAADQQRLNGMSPPQVAAFLADFYGYTDFVKQRGVTDQRARQCLGDRAAIEAIARNAQVAQERYDVSGTPTFLLNGQVLRNTVEWSQVQAALRTAGAL